MDNRDESIRLALMSIETEHGDAVADEFKKGIAAWDMIQGATSILTSAADPTKPQNYVKMEVVGLRLPFDRVEIVLVRPGGLTPHDKSEQRGNDIRTLCGLIDEITEDTPDRPARLIAESILKSLGRSIDVKVDR